MLEDGSVDEFETMVADSLDREVERTLRHELAHHLGWGEHGVGELGL